MKLFFFFLLFSITSFAQDIDVQHYKFSLTLTDESNEIEGRADISLKFLRPVEYFRIHLIRGGSQGKGMRADVASDWSGAAAFDDTSITIRLKQPVVLDSVYNFTVLYQGEPKDGLIISQNRHGDRTFFSDNWPNRARHWIPCNDRPDDKASFEFIVTAPAHYRVISNGVLVEETELPGNGKRTHWKTEVPLSTKVMVIGAARFAVKEYGKGTSGIPVSAWIFEKDSALGFHDYAAAPKILDFFTHYIAPYPFEKLANVQSKTIFGGMENASAIFFNETSVNGKAEVEDLLAHEIAHQWFGDMASESSFSHLWLSEGFATYLTHIYLEQQYGADRLKKGMEEDRQQVIAFFRKQQRAVVDSTSTFMELLNANSYQKGGWILHMLRKETGNEVFQKILQAYYQQYKGGNATTRDFEKVAEIVSDSELTWFFDQWLYRAGLPQLQIQREQTKEGIRLTVVQKQKDLYRIAFPIYVESAKDRGEKRYLQIQDRTTSILIPESNSRIVFDPDVELLWEEMR